MDGQAIVNSIPPPPLWHGVRAGDKKRGRENLTRFLYKIYKYCWCIGAIQYFFLMLVNRKGRLGYLPVRGRHLSILSWNSISTDLQNSRSINSKTKAHIIGSSGLEITKKICCSFTKFVWNLLFGTPKYFSKLIPATKNCWSSWMRLNRNGFCSAESVTF